MLMEVLEGFSGRPQLLPWGAGVIALLLTIVTVCSLPSLMEYWRRWWMLNSVPGVSPCYPVLGNALLLERKGEGNAGSHCSLATVSSLRCLGFAGGTSAGGEVLVWLSSGWLWKGSRMSEDVLLPLRLSWLSAERNSVRSGQ